MIKKLQIWEEIIITLFPVRPGSPLIPLSPLPPTAPYHLSSLPIALGCSQIQISARY
jgi:hypothetical protein